MIEIHHLTNVRIIDEETGIVYALPDETPAVPFFGHRVRIRIRLRRIGRVRVVGRAFGRRQGLLPLKSWVWR